jgi:pro-sigmaK processing inhibitor BofA
MDLTVMIVAAVIALALILIFKGKAIKSILKSSITGLLGVGIINALGGITGITLSLNMFTIITSALLGIPGIATLLLMKYIWTA